MIKFCTLLLLIGTSLAHSCDTNKVEQAAKKCDETQDYFFNRVRINSSTADSTVVSYFNLSHKQSVIEKILQPNTVGHYDFRELETMYCKLAQKSQPIYVAHRGKFGLIAGILLTAPLLLYNKYTEDKN